MAKFLLPLFFIVGCIYLCFSSLIMGQFGHLSRQKLTHKVTS